MALESEGVASVVQNEPGGALPFIPSSILVEDADYDRALPIVQELEPRNRDEPYAVYKRTWRMTLILLIIVVALLSIWLLF